MTEFILAREEDAPQIAGLRQKVWRSVYRGIYSDEMIDCFDFAWHTRQDLRRIQSGEYMVYRIVTEGQNVGYLTLKQGEPLYLMSLYVLPQFQRQGIGRQAFALVRGYCRGQGVFTFLCDCQPQNAKAMAFYSKMGGRIIARDEENEEHWQDSVTFAFQVKVLE